MNGMNNMVCDPKQIQLRPDVISAMAVATAKLNILRARFVNHPAFFELALEMFWDEERAELEFPGWQREQLKLLRQRQRILTADNADARGLKTA